MKTYQCECSRKREVEDNIVMVICYECQKEMKEVKDGRYVRR